MAVSVPGAKPEDTALTATWPPKRMVSSRVSRAKFIASRDRSGVSFRRRRSAPAARPLGPTRGRRLPSSAFVANRDVHLFDCDQDRKSGVLGKSVDVGCG